jgi:hypothetical protein
LHFLQFSPWTNITASAYFGANSYYSSFVYNGSGMDFNIKGRHGFAKKFKTCDIAKSAFFTFIKARFSPSSIEISSLTTATQAFELGQKFSYPVSYK